MVDPHAVPGVGVENSAGESLGNATALDTRASIKRVRRKPEAAAMSAGQRSGPNLVELAHERYHGDKDLGV